MADSGSINILHLLQLKSFNLSHCIVEIASSPYCNLRRESQQ
ncbi:unnamed protein product, partial [Larinioides sclopetarius]